MTKRKVATFLIDDRLPPKLLANIATSSSDCWIWTASHDGNGYGSVRFAGRQRSTHRLVYELLVGPIPDGLVIDHLCRVPACCNPGHLEAVTRRTNNIRGVGWAGTHARKTHCVNGHPFAGSNLYLHPDGRRVCRSCVAAAKRRRRHDQETRLLD